MRVLGFGTYDAARHPRVGVVLEGLRARGHDVVEIDEPLGFETARRVEMLRRPWKASSFLWKVAEAWLRLARRARRARRDGAAAGPDLVVVGYMGHFDVVLARLLYRGSLVALDQLVFAADTARDRGVGGGLRLRALDVLDRVAVSCADLVLLDTDEHRELVPARRRERAVVVPVGAPPAWFAAGVGGRKRLAPGSPLSVVFFGLFTPLQGAAVIAEAVASLPPGVVQVTMVGSGQDRPAALAAAREHPDVTWKDWVPAAELPALTAAHDVCLGIFGTTPKALRVVPNKVYQGAAAGCAVVTSDTAPQRRALGEAALFVPPGDAGALAAALTRLAADRPLVADLASRARRRAERDFTPEAVVEPLERRLTEWLR